MCVCVCVCELLSHVSLFATPWTIACQPPLSMEFLQARILEWAAMPSSRGMIQRLNPGLLHCRWIHYRLSHPGKPLAQEIAPQIALKGCSKEAGRKLSTRMTLVKQEHSTCNQTHISYERSLLAMRNRPQIGGPSRFSRYEEMKESGSQNLLNYLTILKTCSACFPQSTEHPIPDLHAELPSGDVEGHLLQQLMI